MSRIIWITRTELTAHQQALQSAMEKNGYSFSIASPDAVSANDSDLAAVFFSGMAPGEAGTYLRGLRANPGTAYVIGIWFYQRWDEGIRVAIEQSGVDDVCSATAEAPEIVLRLALRRKAAETKALSDRQLKEHSSRIAKSETTLKQREEFLSVCAHDLRSPMGLIQSSISLLLNDPQAALSPFHVELLTRAKRQAGHAITLVGDLLDVMAYEQGLKPQYEMIDLHTLLNEFYKDYRFQAEQKEVSFHYENPIQNWRVLADSDRIRQLLQNLFTNALKFTDHGKNIYLRVTPFNGRRKKDPPYPMIVISLRDEGRGIPHKEIEKIFDRFSQIKDQSRAEGRGLGLTVAKQISTSHDGNIWVQSEEGSGSTFFVLFPHVISRTEPAAPHPNRVLIVEPSALRREQYFRQLEKSGYELTFVRDGVEAITYLFHVLPALVFLNPGLAKINEAEVANIVKTDPMTSGIPLILALEESQAAKKKNDTILVDKRLILPFSPESLKEALEEIKNQRNPRVPIKTAA